MDHDALAALTRSLAATGIRGFVVCGSTGEAASLDPDEQLACLHTVAAHVGGLLLIVYDIPYRTGAILARETLLVLVAHSHIRAVKDCGGDSGKTLALLADGWLEVLAGEDLQIFGHLA